MPDPETIAGVVITLLVTGLALVATIELVDWAGHRRGGRRPKGRSPIGEPIEIIEVGPAREFSEESPTSERGDLAARAIGALMGLTDEEDEDEDDRDAFLEKVFSQLEVGPHTASTPLIVVPRTGGFLTQAAAQEIIEQVVGCFPDESEEFRERVRETVAEAIANAVMVGRENV